MDAAISNEEIYKQIEREKIEKFQDFTNPKNVECKNRSDKNITAELEVYLIKLPGNQACLNDQRGTPRK